MVGDDIASMVQDAVDKAQHDVEQVELLITGRTGVGKSTLINEVFSGQLAHTGQGKTVTREVRRYTKEDIPLAITDTRGLESKHYRSIVDDLMAYVDEQDRRGHQRIHIVWICVAEDSRRVEDGEVELHKRLAKDRPVLGVITKCRNDQGFRAEVQELLPDASNVVRVRAMREVLDDGHQLDPEGLIDLVDATIEVLPNALRMAFAAAQKVSLDSKKRQAHRVVATAVLAAGAAAATPIPFSDAVLLVPIQLTMLGRITKIFQTEASLDFLRALIATVAGTTATTLAGRAIVSNLLKMLPGVGSVAGGTISATTAGTMTTALGELYIQVLARLFEESGGEAPSQNDILREVRNSLSNR